MNSISNNFNILPENLSYKLYSFNNFFTDINYNNNSFLPLLENFNIMNNDLNLKK